MGKCSVYGTPYGSTEKGGRRVPTKIQTLRQNQMDKTTIAKTGMTTTSWILDMILGLTLLSIMLMFRDFLEVFLPTLL
jgi:hypothetical protein